MTLSFYKWKRKFLKDRVCHTPEEVNIWLRMHGVNETPSLVSKYAGWICRKTSDGKVCLTRNKLILSIRGFKKPYRRIIISLMPIKFMIKREYFNIFGNTCKIINTDVRTIERHPISNVILRLTVITALVKTQYKEERSGYKISHFYLKAKKRRNSDSTIPMLNKTRLKIKSKSTSNFFSTYEKIPLIELMRQYQWSTQTYHKRLVHYFTENIEKNIDNPRLVLMFGVPGCGKNWLLDKRRKKNHVIINVDDCLAMLPDYWRGMLALQERDKQAHDWIKTFRGECKVIAQQLFQFAVDNRMNIVWNGTGKSIDKYEKLMELAKKKGYIIELNGIWVPLKIAKKRMQKRRDSYGRAVPEDVFNIAALNIPASFKCLRERADYARIWSNNSTTSPRVLWDKQQGWVDQKIKDDVGWISTHSNTNLI